MIIFECPSCHSRFQTTADRGGSKIECSNCGQRLMIPKPRTDQGAVSLRTSRPPEHANQANRPEVGARSSASDAQVFYYLSGGERRGPLGFQELQRLAAARQLAPSDQVWSPSTNAWVPAKSISGLFADSKETAAPSAAREVMILGRFGLPEMTRSRIRWIVVAGTIGVVGMIAIAPSFVTSPSRRDVVVARRDASATNQKEPDTSAPRKETKNGTEDVLPLPPPDEQIPKHTKDAPDPPDPDLPPRFPIPPNVESAKDENQKKSPTPSEPHLGATDGRREEAPPRTTTDIQNMEARDPIVRLLLGKTLFQYTKHGYKEVSLGDSFDSIDGRTPLRWTRRPIAPFVFLKDRDGTEEFIFDADKRLISFSKSYPGSPDAYMDKLVSLFGKSDRDPVINDSTGYDVVYKRTAAHYTFKDTLARLLFVKTIGGNSMRHLTGDAVHVTVVDRKWVTSMLDMSATAKRKNLDWIAEVARSIERGDLNPESMPTITGTVKKIESKVPLRIVFEDVATERRNMSLPEPKRIWSSVATVSTGRLNDGRDDPTVIRMSFHFDRYTPNYVGTVYEQPERKGGPFTSNITNPVSYTSLFDMPIEIDALLLKSYFPPESSVTTVRRSEFGISHLSYEWRATNGWKVSCGFNESVTLEYQRKKDL